MWNIEKLRYYIVGFILTLRLLTDQLPEVIFYAFILVMFLTLYLSAKEIRIKNKGIFFFVIFIFLSIILNTIPSFFQPYPRFGTFLLNLLVFSPLFVSSRLSNFRITLFFVICNLFTAYTLISLAGLLAGFYPLQGLGGFQGMTVHAMSLSVIAAISILYNLMNYLEFKKRIYIFIVAISFIVLILGASRAALVGCGLGFFMLIFKYKNFKFATVKPLIAIIVIMLLLLLIIPEKYFGKLNQKFEGSQESGSTLSSRESLWDARLLEFKDSPIYGIGFGNMIEEYNDYGINKETGGIETGSSWGMILSMTGLLGIITFILIIFRRYRYIVVNKNSLKNSFILGVFTFFLIHMIFEGYVFASGNIFMIFFWLTLSITHYNFKEQ